MATAALLLLAEPGASRGDEPVAAPREVAPAPATMPAPARPAVRTFDVWEIGVDGNTALDDSDIQETLAPFLGPGRTAKDMDDARQALQALYRDQGFQTVTVQIAPESRKTVASGQIILKVTEGKIHKLTVSGAKYFSTDRVRDQVPSLVEGTVPDFEAVQRDLADLSRLPDRQVTPTINRDEATGDLNVDLAVADKLPLHGLVEVNNRYSNGTSHQRAMAMLSYDNMFQRGDSMSLMMQTAPQRQADGKVYFASYLERFADPTFTLQFTALKMASDVAAIGGTNIVGQGRSFGAKALWQYPAGGGWAHGYSVGVDYKDFLNQVQLGKASLDSPLTYYPLTLSLNTSRQDEKGSARYQVDFMTVLPGLGSDTGTIDLSRYEARRQMHWLRGSTTHVYEMPRAFQASLAGSAQVTDVPLVSNEQLSIGGMDTVRGYLEAESTGDRGITGSGELRTPPVSLLFAEKSWAKQVNEGRLYLFLDAGYVALQGPLPDNAQHMHTDLYSTGAGMTLGVFGHANALLEWAEPLVDGPYTKKHDSRVLFRAWATF